MTSSYIFLNGLRIHYLRWNTESDQPIVLLHGLASNARIWELVAPLLFEQGFNPLAWDARGHGLSDKPEDYSFQAITGDLAAFIEACHLERPILVGHSWGGRVVLDYAARFSSGPRSPAGIVLVDGGINQLNDLPGATWEATRDRLTPPHLAGTPLEEFISRLKVWNAGWLPEDEERQEQILSIILANFDVDDNEKIAPHLSFDHHMQIVRHMWDFKTIERIERLRCPSLAILARLAPAGSSGEDQFLMAKERAVIRARTIQPGLQITWLENTIHDIPLQRPQELAGMITSFARSLEPAKDARIFYSPGAGV